MHDIYNLKKVLWYDSQIVDNRMSSNFKQIVNFITKTEE